MNPSTTSASPYFFHPLNGSHSPAPPPRPSPDASTSHAAPHSHGGQGTMYALPSLDSSHSPNSFFSSNHSLQHQQDPYALPPSSHLPSLPPLEFPSVDSEESPGSTTSGRPRKKKRLASSGLGEAGRGSDEESSGTGIGGESDEDKGVGPPLGVVPVVVGKGKRGRGVKGKGKKKGESEEEESEFEGKKVKGKQRKQGGDKKKKAGRACAACQKAHLTCDDARPCARCVKKGCPDQCQDGARKKAKYLQEIPDELLERRPPVVARPPPVEEVPQPQPQLVPDGGGDSGESPHDIDAMAHNAPHQPFNFDTLYYDTNSFANEFGSEAANLEYAILSSMLNGNGFSDQTYHHPAPEAHHAEDARLSGGANGSTMLINSPLGGTLGLGGMDRVPVVSAGHTPSYGASIFGGGGGRGTGSSATSPAGGMSFGSIMSPPRMQDTVQDLFPSIPGIPGLKPDLSTMRSTSDSHSPSGFGGEGAAGSGSGNLSFQLEERAYEGRTAQSTKMLTAEEAYRAVTKPYPYAQSYHYLVRHLKERFEKNDILRIIRALATFRPSLIALQMPLTEEDETFVERTFQRTLVELNKLISFSGTPTVVWRRTGEICLVGTEFCLLTGWSREELLGKKYIFELFDTSSVVEYYESFAKHAFESTSSSVMSQCVVLGPSGRPVPCAFCFSVRRDLFSCPFLVIGSFLPVLV